MATIKVRVNGEIATNLTPEVRLVCQNDKYDVEFEFDESWVNSNFKTALFIYNGKSIAVPFDREQNGNVCKIPALYETELLHIGVKSSDVEGLHTSTPARVGCLLSANDIANGEIPNPTPSQYDEIIALLNMYITGGGSGEGVDLRDYQKKVDNALETTDKTIVGAINEVNDKVGQGGSGSAEVEFGETKGTAYEGHKGKQNADNIAGLQEMVNSFNADLADLTEKVDLMQPKSDETLPTESKEIVGAINELYEREDKQGLTEEQVKEIVKETAVTQESDPTVPNWAKQPEKPTYTYEEITGKPDLVEDIGSSLAEETNVLTIELKDKSGKVIASTEVVIPKGGGETPDLSAYLQKVNTPAKPDAYSIDTSPYNVYAVDINGNQIMVPAAFGQYVSKTGIARYKDGRLSGAAPTNDGEYTTKAFVRDLPEKITLTDDQKSKWRAWLGIE